LLLLDLWRLFTEIAAAAKPTLRVGIHAQSGGNQTNQRKRDEAFHLCSR
jgi:hypothetical protein